MEQILEVSTSIEGSGLIIGFGSANPVSEENYFDHKAKTYEGRLRAAVRASGEDDICLHFVACEKSCDVRLRAE